MRPVVWGEGELARGLGNDVLAMAVEERDHAARDVERDWGGGAVWSGENDSMRSMRLGRLSWSGLESFFPSCIMHGRASGSISTELKLMRSSISSREG